MAIFGCQYREEVRGMGRRDMHVHEVSNRIIPDREFNNIMTGDVKAVIAEAFISLEAGLRLGKPEQGLSNWEIALIEKKAGQMKQEINDFIDSQKQRIIVASEARWHNGPQVPE